MDLNNKLQSLGSSMVNKTSYTFEQRPLSLVMKKKRRKLVRTIVIAAAVIILSTAVVATTPLGQIFSQLNGGMGLNIAEKNENIDYPIAEVKDKNITMKVMAAVAGNEKIIISLKFIGLDQDKVDQYVNNEHYQEYYRPRVPNEVWKQYPSVVHPDKFSIRLEDGQTGKLAPEYKVVYMPRVRNEDGSYVENYEINATIDKTQKINLDISNIAGIDGNWSCQFELTYRAPKVMQIDQEFTVYEGRFFIKNITIDTFSTTIEFQTNGVDFLNYLTTIESNKEFQSMKNFTGVIPNSVEECRLPDGTKSYKYIMRPLPDDAVVTINSRSLDELDIPFIYEINFQDY